MDKQAGCALLGLLLVFLMMISLVFGLTALMGKPDQTKEFLVEWREINPPPGIAGPCWAYAGYHGLEGVYCSDAGPTEEEMQKMFELGRGG